MTMNKFIDKSFEPLQLHIKGLKERNAELTGQKASNEVIKAIIRKYYNCDPSCKYSYEDLKRWFMFIDKQAKQFF